MPLKVEMTGKRFNRFLVLKEGGRANDGKVMWVCQCDCGTIKEVSGSELRGGGTRSCGCLASEFTVSRNKTHGLSSMPEYGVWKGIKKRCFNVKELHYKEYGERGITMCDRWKNSFENFISDMGQRPGDEYTIDRIDFNGNYEPGNCRWVTMKVQGNNKRNNRIIEYRGIKKTLQQWADHLGINVSTLHSRLKVRSVENAFQP